MGCADIIPGVSGGTVALILGIYEQLIDSIRLVDGLLIRSLFTRRFWSLLVRSVFGTVPLPDPADHKQVETQRRVDAVCFIGFLVLGILVAIAAAAKVITLARDGYPEVTRGFFLGLVAASVRVPFLHMKRRTVREFATAALFAVGTWLLLGLGQIEATDPSLLYVFLCGALAITAMILPGISGAFILLMLGMYDPVLKAVKELVYDRDFSGVPTLAVLVLGILVGIAAFSRLLNYLLKNHHDITMGALVGLMLGSLRVLWPYKAAATMEGVRTETLENVLPVAADGTLIATLGFFLLGIALVLVLERVGRRYAR
jgi:putative membrane protein